MILSQAFEATIKRHMIGNEIVRFGNLTNRKGKYWLISLVEWDHLDL